MLAELSGNWEIVPKEQINRTFGIPEPIPKARKPHVSSHHHSVTKMFKSVITLFLQIEKFTNIPQHNRTVGNHGVVGAPQSRNRSEYDASRDDWQRIHHTCRRFRVHTN